MSDHDLEVSSGSKSSVSQQSVDRQVGEADVKSSPFIQRDPLDQVTCRAGDKSCATAHASVLNRSTASQPSLAGPSLLQLQRQYGNRYVQRVVTLARATEGEGDVMPEVERAIESSRGGGQSLDSGVQAQMGQALNADFSGVRVHTDVGADGLNRSISARAFTTGRDIYFRQGEYNPGNSSGRELLAHELTHVVQQNPDKIQTKSDDDGSQSGCTCGSSAAPAPQMKLTVSEPGDQYEQEADRIANAVMHQEQTGTAGSSQAQSIHRQMPEEDKEKLQGKYHDDKISRQMEEEEEKPV